MTQLLNALKSYIVLSLGDLTHIKETISRRYGHMTSSERAEILSMAVHNHLNKHLVGIDEANKEALKLSILSTTLAVHRYSITRMTIFDAILDLNLEENVKADLADSWLKESAQLTIPRRTLENYMQDASRFSGEMPINISESESVEVVDQPLYFDTTEKEKRWTIRPHFGLIAAVLAAFILMIPATLFLTGKWIAGETHQLSLTSHLDAKDYTGLYALDRVYLIDDISGYTKDDQVYLTLEKSRYDFGLTKQSDTFRFASFNYFSVKQYIATTRGGLIGASEQYNQIIHQAFLNDIDPLLLFAIIGQEQAFVPDTSVNSLKILNNPYNVFHSWAEYNTTLRDSTQIAINTIKNRLNKAPFSASPFIWLNATYAEDVNWHIGVRLIYAHLNAIGRTSSIQ